VTLNDGQADGQFTIVRIEPAPVDVMPAESSSAGVLVETMAAE
jgi:hypothetical protein